MSKIEPKTTQNSDEKTIAPERNLAKLGDYAFSYKSGAFNEIARSTTYNFAVLDRASAPSLLQKTGGVEEEISFTAEFLMQKLSVRFSQSRREAQSAKPDARHRRISGRVCRFGNRRNKERFICRRSAQKTNRRAKT